MKKCLSLLIAASITLCGCVYHPPIYQGNVLTPKKIQMIHEGMSSADVVATLGSPVLQSIYADDKMTYIYTSEKTYGNMSVKKMEIYFHNDRVSNVKTWM